MTGPSTKEDFEALRALETEWLACALENTLANLGYPVGMGVTLNEADSRKIAGFLFNRYLMMFERVANVASKAGAA